MPRRWLVLGVLLAPATLPAQSGAQQDPRVGVLAALLAAEDRRAWDPVLFDGALRAPDPLVRRQAILAAGRIRDPRAGPALLAQLRGQDTTTQAAAMFALGVLGDSTLAAAIIERLGDPEPLATGAVLEAPGALAKLGSGEARTLFSRLLDGTSRAVSPQRREAMLPGLLVEGWRFGQHAPVDASLAHLASGSDSVRWRAAYLLGRTRAAAGTRGLLERAADPHPWVRQYALRGLTRAAGDSAGLPRDSVLPVLGAALTDRDPGVRINALGSLASWADPGLVAPVLPLLRDPIPNVRLQAATTLGALGGAAALGALRELADAGHAPLVLRREAMLGLLRADTAGVRSRAAAWTRSTDPAVRAAALEFAPGTGGGDLAPFAALIRDPDPGVAAGAWLRLRGRTPALDGEILSEASAHLGSPESTRRSAAWSVIGSGQGSASRVALLVQGWEQELARGPGGATGTILTALRRIHASGAEGRRIVDSLFVSRAARPADYLLRRAATGWPELAARWGPVYPAEVRYQEAGYRDIVTRFLLPSGSPRPRIVFETEGRGVVEVELLGDQAPLTVANFLGLVDRAFFDGGEWHRVIPNFVVQDGAGRRGGPEPPDGPIRDEINPVRYDEPVLGMALSGPDTGTTQWFINLSPQPHLDGGYTVFGRVVAGTAALYGILQGDRIRAIRR